MEGKAIRSDGWRPRPESWNFRFLALDKAANWEEFNQALRHYPGPEPGNFIYA